MCDKLMLSLEQAQSAIAAMISDYNRIPDRRKVDKAVVDDAGNLSGMDRCLRPTSAMRNADTFAVREVDTLAFTQQLASWPRSIESFGVPQLIAIPGSVVALKSGAVVGVIGVRARQSGLETNIWAGVVESLSKQTQTVIKTGFQASGLLFAHNIHGY